MAPTEKPADATRVSCEICLKEIPKSEASVPEAVDYFVYFCGSDCYQQWAHRGPQLDVAGGEVLARHRVHEQ